MRLLHLVWCGYRLQRVHCWAAFLILPVAWGAMSLTAPEDHKQLWFWMEGFVIPISVIWGIDAFLGRYERRELELFLARRSARFLFAILTAPVALFHVTALILLANQTSISPGYEVMTRFVLLYGVSQFIGILTRSRWIAISALTVWWLVGLLYMTDWVAVPGVLGALHPMRLSGGGGIRADLELIDLALGGLSLVSSWLSVGRDTRWLY